MRTPILVSEKYLLLSKGPCGEADNCPIALAILDQTGIKASVIGPVAGLEIPEGHFSYPSGTHRFVEMPGSVDKFVRDWENGRPTDAPFIFLFDTERIAGGWALAASLLGMVECEER